MKKILGKLMLRIPGWKLINEVPLKQMERSVLIAAPHTSNWDFYYCIAALWALDVPFRVFIKDAYTRPWFGFFFKALGCIGVDRSQRTHLVDYAATLIKKSEKMVVINTPEGTRSYADKWKKGFYFIAKEANVPIILACGDYKNKRVGIGKIIHIENKSIEEVFDEIESYYKPEMAKFPKMYNPKIH